ncbi:MAG: 3-hydroxyacyl-ACP dehydratase FabZ [Gammaproteobacteria bacterium]|nr:3-hydroxyacyl-ACP dehydratase FabZ [Gammaproteobacteria bacterium]
MSESLKVNEILNYLPHRFPFMLVDKVLEYEAGKRLVAIKNVTFNEPFFAGHFPGNPVMPGVLIIEALAQAGCILAFLSNNDDVSSEELYLFAGIDNARFRRVVIPGDQLKLDITITKIKSNVLKVNAIASVDGEEACSAEIMSIRSKVEK